MRRDEVLITQTGSYYAVALISRELLRSDDLGQSWTALRTGVWSHSVHADGTVYLSDASALWLSTDDGKTFEKRGEDGAYMLALAVDRDDPAVVYAGSASGVYVSTDGGLTLRQVLEPEGDRWGALRLRTNPYVSDQVYAIIGENPEDLEAAFNMGDV